MKKNIAVLCGGNSRESEISMDSASMIMKNIDTEKFIPYKVFISNKKWVVIIDNSEFPIDKNDFTFLLNGEKIHFQCAFIAIHGTPGEDGKIQGYLDLVGMPYTTSGSIVSAVTFDKDFCSSLAKMYGALIPNSLIFRTNQKINLEYIIKTLELPCFVKPNKSGSSIGNSKINKIEELQQAIDNAFKEDDEILVEEFIEGTEVTCGILKINGEITTLPVTEIVCKHEFFDFDAKYYDKKTEEITPARIPKLIFDECQQISKVLFIKFKLDGMARFDYILKDGKLFFLEVNTVPGLTQSSIIPKQVQTLGISPTELYSMVIDDAIIRYVV